MRRAMSTAGFVLPLVMLALGPWLGIAQIRPTAAVEPTAPWYFPDYSPTNERLRAVAPPVGTRGRTECNCRTVDVNLRNHVSEAKVRTGPASVVNANVTYVAAGYGDREVEIDQEAFAFSGDAVAGQLVGVDARGPKCVNVRVRAVNRVEDSVVESGDASAVNRAIVLLDPGVRRGDLEIDIEQEAVAQSGDAIAGQVIGIVSGGGSGRCRGRVDLTAVNEVLRTRVETGHAFFRNESEVRRCAAVGCAAELMELLGEDVELEVCSGDDCREVDADELGAVLARTAREDDVEETDTAEDDADRIEEASDETASCSEEAATPAPTAAPEDPDAYEPRASSRPPPRYTPPPTPTPPPPPTPPPCATAWPGAEPDDDDEDLMASSAEGTTVTRD